MSFFPSSSSNILLLYCQLNGGILVDQALFLIFNVHGDLSIAIHNMGSSAHAVLHIDFRHGKVHGVGGRLLVRVMRLSLVAQITTSGGSCNNADDTNGTNDADDN